MSKPLFSIVLICKNEANTLPKLFASLREFLSRGGEVCLLDTGSTDDTVNIAEAYGAKVTSVGEKFIEVLDNDTAEGINARFIAGVEPKIVSAGNRLFNFAAARNYVSSLATNDFIVTMDGDEAYSRLNIDKLNHLISEGYEQFEYQFVYAHDHSGNPAVQFVQSKAFDRRKMKWSGVVHEVLSGDAKRIYIDQSDILLEHWQEPGKDHRGNYLVGLALDCYQNPDKDRQSFYFARELMYTGRYRSAIMEFERHQKFNGWDAERAQGKTFIGDCYGYLGDRERQIEWYLKSFNSFSKRREPLLRLAHVFKEINNPHAVAAYANAALALPYVDFYANNMVEYRELPHELLYWACGHIGDVEAAKWHLMRCLDYAPLNPKFLHDTRYYFEYPSSFVDGWFTYREQLWAYEIGKRLNGKTIAEVGSWKGRSTNAFATGNKDGKVFCIDTWAGSEDLRDDTNWMAKREDVYAVFCENTKQFTNITPIRKTSVEAAVDFEDNSLDLVFIDAGHTYKDVVSDIDAWLPKVKKGGIISGHDYMPNTWQEVIEAVNDKLGAPDELHDTVWVKYVR